MAAQASLRFRSAGGVSTASARVVAAPRGVNSVNSRERAARGGVGRLTTPPS